MTKSQAIFSKSYSQSKCSRCKNRKQAYR